MRNERYVIVSLFEGSPTRPHADPVEARHNAVGAAGPQARHVAKGGDVPVDIPFYGKVINGFYAVKSKGKSGTTRFNRLATLHCVVNGSRLTLGVEVARKGESNAGAAAVADLPQAPRHVLVNRA